jgi:hypothetical protein
MNEDLIEKEELNSSVKTKEDALRIVNELIEKKNQIIDDSPKLSLRVKNAPLYLASLFEEDGTPKGDFRVSDRYRKKVCLALKHQGRKNDTGEIYYGKLFEGINDVYPAEYLIQVTPTLLNDQELRELSFADILKKRIGGIEVELIPPMLQDNINFGKRVRDFMEINKPVRDKINKIDEIIYDLKMVLNELPSAIPSEQINNSDETGYPHV